MKTLSSISGLVLAIRSSCSTTWPGALLVRSVALRSAGQPPEVLDGRSDPGGQDVRRRPAELPAGPRRVDRRIPYVTEPGGRELRLVRCTGRPCDQRVQLLVAGLHAGADVVAPPITVLARSQQERRRDVPDEHVVPGVPA